MRKHWYIKAAALLLSGAAALCALSACERNQVELDNEVIRNFTPPQEGEEIVVLTIRDYGDVKIKLFPEATEKGVENFTTLVKNGFYDELIFHRVIDKFMIQGGDPKGNGTGGVDAWGSQTGFAQTISPDLHHFTGAVAYAIGSDKLNKSQFYIVTGDKLDDEQFSAISEMTGMNFSPTAMELYKQVGGYPSLDGGYEIFGQVFDGMEHILEIQKTATDANDKPKSQIQIEKAEVVPYDGTAPEWLSADGQPVSPQTNITT